MKYTLLFSATLIVFVIGLILGSMILWYNPSGHGGYEFFWAGMTVYVSPILIALSIISFIIILKYKNKIKKA